MNIWEKLTDTSGIVNINKEFEKRYFGTFLEWTKTSGEIVYTYIYDKDETTYHFRLKEGTIVKFDICEDNPILNTINLKKGFYSTRDDKIYYISQIPKRQWKRSLYIDNYKTNNFFDYFVFLDNFSNKRTMFFSFLENKPIDIVDTKIFKTCLDKNFTIINTNFLLTKSICSPEGFSLFYHKYLLGNFNAEGNIFVLKDSPFIQEFIEESNKWCFNFNIKHSLE